MFYFCDVVRKKKPNKKGTLNGAKLVASNNNHKSINTQYKDEKTFLA